MTFKEFDLHQDKFIQEACDMAMKKGKEYAYSEQDRFQNFNEIAKMLEIPRAKVAMVYTMKHIFSLISYVNKNREFSDEKISSRIADIIIYMTLIEGMIFEDRNADASSIPQFDPSKVMKFEASDSAKEQINKMRTDDFGYMTHGIDRTGQVTSETKILKG